MANGFPLLAVILTCSVVVVALLVSLHGKSRRRAASLSCVNRQLRRANCWLAAQAGLDPLTRLLNRMAFGVRMRESVAQCDRLNMRAPTARLGMLLVSLDNFRPVNDALGHEVGDAILRESSRRLQSAARPCDVIARVGSDEFVVLVEGLTSVVDAQVLAARIARNLQEPFEISPGRELRVGVSVGIAAYPDHGPSDRLITHAETALNEARRASGGALAVFQRHMACDAAEQVLMQSDLRQAVERREFLLHYQPKIDVRHGNVVGVQALLRWHHPERGLVLPSLFIPIAERFGLISSIGAWVIEEACRQMRSWADEGHVINVEVHVSALQLRSASLVTKTVHSLSRHRIGASQLLCKIAAVALDEVTATQSTLEELGKVGIPLSVDSLGLWCPGPSLPERQAVRQLRIDPRHILDLEANRDMRPVVSSVVNLAHARGWSVLAGGVETAEQERMLVELGCDELQGHRYARPMPGEQLLQWMTTQPVSLDAARTRLRPGLHATAAFHAATADRGGHLRAQMLHGHT